MYLFFYMGLVLSGFEGGKSTTRASLGGTRYARSHFRAQKVLILGPLPLKWPLVWFFCPPQNHYVPHNINNRYINSYLAFVLFVPKQTFREEMPTRFH
jgi:hypothetical protein